MFACLLHRRVNAVDVGGSSRFGELLFLTLFSWFSLSEELNTLFFFSISLCCSVLLLLDVVNHYKIQLLSHFSACFCTRCSLQLMRCFFLPIFVSLLLSCCRSSALALPFGLSGSNYPAVLSQNSCRREEGCGLCVRLQAGVSFFACRFTFSLRLHPSLFFPGALGNSPDVKLLGG